MCLYLLDSKLDVLTFILTLTGDWAGNSYASRGCPGTCAERIMDPANFVNATWSINSVRVFKKTLLAGTNTIPSSAIRALAALEIVLFVGVAFIFYNVG